jgi:hypothetical protein
MLFSMELSSSRPGHGMIIDGSATQGDVVPWILIAVTCSLPSYGTFVQGCPG